MPSVTALISSVIIFAGFVMAGIMALFWLFSHDLSTMLEHARLAGGVAAVIVVYGFGPRLYRAAARRLARLRRAV